MNEKRPPKRAVVFHGNVIFSTNIRNEYAHIWNVMKRKFEGQAADSLNQLMSNSKAFRSRDAKN